MYGCWCLICRRPSLGMRKVSDKYVFMIETDVMKCYYFFFLAPYKTIVISEKQHNKANRDM